MKISQQCWLFVAFSAISLFYVLYVFKGYGIYQGNSLSGHSLLSRAMLFGALNGLLMWLLEFVVSAKLSFGGLMRKIAWRLVELFLGGSATFLLFNYFWQWTDFNFPVYSEILLEYTLVMLIPIFITELFGLFQNQVASSQITMLSFIAENGKDTFQIRADELLYIKSESNYVELFYRTNEKVKSHVLRTTLKAILADPQLEKQLKQTHRSYLVNERMIKQITREKGKMYLAVGHVKIPVTKKFESTFNFIPE